MNRESLVSETVDQNSFLVAHQLLRRAEYRCRWQLLGMSSLSDEEISITLISARFLDPSHTEEINSEWGDMSAKLREDIHTELFPGVEVDRLRSLHNLSQILYSIARQEMQKTELLAPAVESLAYLQQKMIQIFVDY